jgi:serine/threonine protein phosphatase PrpC
LVAGHGGRHCADYISTALPLRITQALSQNEENLPLSSILTASFKDVDDAIIQAVRNNFSSVLRWHMPRSARQKMIDVMLRRSDARESVLRAQSGSTALVAVIEDESITLANVGDCRAGRQPVHSSFVLNI